MAADATVMLGLLHEAGEEAVTLDELGVAGVDDPARALLELELAGLRIQRVLVRDARDARAVACIRLAPSTPTPAPPLRSARLPGLLVVGLLLALVALLARRA